MKASDLFVKCLEEEGIEYIFGVPGEENADFMMSLERSDKITFVLTRHEQGAAFHRIGDIFQPQHGTPLPTPRRTNQHPWLLRFKNIPGV